LAELVVVEQQAVVQGTNIVFIVAYDVLCYEKGVEAMARPGGKYPIVLGQDRKDTTSHGWFS